MQLLNHAHVCWFEVDRTAPKGHSLQNNINIYNIFTYFSQDSKRLCHAMYFAGGVFIQNGKYLCKCGDQASKASMEGVTVLLEDCHQPDFVANLQP